MHRNLIIICVICVLNFFICATNADEDETWNDFFWERRYYTSEELEEDVPEIPKQLIELKKVTSSLNNITLEYNIKDGHLFKLFGTGYVLLDTLLYNITIGRKTYLSESPYQFSRVYPKINLVGSTVYDGKGFVILAYSRGLMDIYGLFDKTSNFVLIQSIDLKKRATSGKFFVNQGDLYLVLATNAPLLYLRSKIYKWTGSHFDLTSLGPIGGFGLDNVASFSKNETTEIILMSEYFNDIPNLKVRQLIFSGGNSNAGPLIPVLEHTEAIETYEDGNIRYLILFQKHHISLFYYDGQQFHKISNTETVPNVSKVFATLIENYVLIYVTTTDKFLIYNPKDTDNLQIVANVTYNETFNQINDMTVIKNNAKDHVFITAINKQNQTVLIEIMVKAEFYDSTTAEITQILSCMTELKAHLGYDHDEHIKHYKTKRSVPNENIVTDAFINSKFSLDSNFPINSNSSIDQVNITLINVIATVNQIEDNIDEMYKSSNDTIYAELNIKGNLIADEILANNINLNTLNNKMWNPNNWLSYSKPQHVTGHYFLKKLQVNKLTTYGDNDPFTDMLYLNGNQTLFGNVTIRSLKANELHISEINDIPFDNIYLKSKPLKITGKKKFENLRADYLTLNAFNGKIIEEYLKPGIQEKQINQNYNLEVNFINGIHWNTFKDSAFQVGKTSTITGNLKINSLITEKLDTNTLAGRNTNDLFTTTTNQEIRNEIIFWNFNTKNIHCNKINGIDLELEVATNLEDIINEIKGPVVVKNMGVFGNIHLKMPLEADLDDTQLKPLQIYDTVKIIGNLHLTNLSTLSNATIAINNKTFDTNTLETFWLKKKQQIIPNHIEALAGITLPHLITTTINDILLNQYMLNDNQDKSSSNFYFENIYIRGNLTTNENQVLLPDLRKLNEDAVRVNGSYIINGKKTYTGKLIVDNLNTTFINDINVKGLKTLNEEDTVGDRYFKKLIVNGNFGTQEAIIENVNNKNVKNMYANTIFIDEPQDIYKLDMENVKVKELLLEEANGRKFNDYILNVFKAFEENALNNVIIHGDLNGTSIVGVEKLNEIDIDALLNIKPEKRSVIFTGPVTIENIETININNVNFSKLFNSLFYRFWQQDITAKHKFKKLYTRNIEVPQINDIKLGKLINVNDPRKQEIISENVKLFNTKFRKSIIAETLECNISKAMFKLIHPDIRKVKNMKIMKNVELWDEDIGLFQLVNNAFHLKKHNIITGSVTFKNLYGRDVITKNNIKNIRLQDIVDDALYKNKRESQVVEGYKEFSIMKTLNAYSQQNVYIPTVNKIHIQKLNESIISKDDINNIQVKGTKTFIEGFQTTNLHATRIAGIPPHDLVSLDNLKDIPKVTFDKLKIKNNLYIDYVNENDFNKFLMSRILKRTENMQELYAVYYFNNVQLNGQTNISTINNMEFADIAFDIGIQYIKANKEFADDVDIIANTRIGKFNGHNLNTLYEESILMNETNHFTNNIEFYEPAILEGEIKTKRINGILIEDVKKILNNTNFEMKANITQSTIRNIAEMVTQNNVIINNLPQKLLYIDYMNNYNLSFTNVIQSQITTSKAELMIHIIDEEENESCNLPTTCTCLVQHTLQITPEYSITPFANKGTQRVYSYNDEQRNIYVITNSLSSSEFCRVNGSSNVKEETTIMYTNANGSSTQEIITNSYISDVKFFSLNNYIYAIISIYYDPISKTHHMESLLIRFSKEMNTIEDKKLIPTNGAWSLNILYTWQGINLVIGNNLNNTLYNSEADLLILRFNETNQDFDLLRKVPIIDHIAITEIVLGQDSFIIIADKYRNVHILKYDYVYDNYYMYQTISFDSPIISLSSFNLDSRDGEPYLCIVTKMNKFFMYTFQFLEGWKLISDGEMEGLLSLIPLELNDNTYLFAPSKVSSNLLSVVKQG